MLKYLLIVLVFCYQSQGYAFVQCDTTKTPVPPLDEIAKNVLNPVSGQNTYYVAQQVFYYTCNDQRTRQYPDGYIVTPGVGVHKLHTRGLSWNLARRACIEEGGHLAVINSDVEEKTLLDIMRDQKIKFAWLGVHDQFQEGDWVSIHDVPLEKTGYSRWSTKWGVLPDNLEGNQNCADLVQPEGGMDDVKCSNPMAFLCEILL